MSINFHLQTSIKMKCRITVSYKIRTFEMCSALNVIISKRWQCLLTQRLLKHNALWRGSFNSESTNLSQLYITVKIIISKYDRIWWFALFLKNHVNRISRRFNKQAPFRYHVDGFKEFQYYTNFFLYAVRY